MSPRKRTPDPASSEAIPVVSTEAPAADTATAVAPPPEESAQGFADRVGPKTYTSTPDPFGIATDYEAGVRLFESRRDRQMAIMFGEGRPEDKPSAEVLAKVKEAGYRWNPDDRIWAHPVRAETAMSTRIDAERLYEEVRQMIRDEKGLEPGKGVPF
jgi:hypothetical protein